MTITSFALSPLENIKLFSRILFCFFPTHECEWPYGRRCTITMSAHANTVCEAQHVPLTTKHTHAAQYVRIAHRSASHSIQIFHISLSYCRQFLVLRNETKEMICHVYTKTRQCYSHVACFFSRFIFGSAVPHSLTRPFFSRLCRVSVCVFHENKCAHKYLLPITHWHTVQSTEWWFFRSLFCTSFSSSTKWHERLEPHASASERHIRFLFHWSVDGMTRASWHTENSHSLFRIFVRRGEHFCRMNTHIFMHSNLAHFQIERIVQSELAVGQFVWTKIN